MQDFSQLPLNKTTTKAKESSHKMKCFHFLVFLALALAFSFASADDPSPLQDFCVAIPEPENAGISLLSFTLLS